MLLGKSPNFPQVSKISFHKITFVYFKHRPVSIVKCFFCGVGWLLAGEMVSENAAKKQVDNLTCFLIFD